MTIVDNIDISHLLKARDVFERFRKDVKTDRDKTAVASTFVFCYELSWKTMQTVLEKRDLEALSPRSVFRQAALLHLIDDPETWFDFLEARNLLVHTYNEEYLEAMISRIEDFSRELDKLIARLKALK